MISQGGGTDKPFKPLRPLDYQLRKRIPSEPQCSVLTGHRLRFFGINSIQGLLRRKRTPEQNAMNSSPDHNKNEKAIRLVEYLLRLSSLRTSLVRDISPNDENSFRGQILFRNEKRILCNFGDIRQIAIQESCTCVSPSRQPLNSDW